MQQKVESYSSSDSDYSNDRSCWISWYCDQPQNSFLCEIDYLYIESAFNLFGLKKEVSHFSRCRDIIIEEMESSASDCSNNVPLKWENEGSADLYGRIHVRYLNTAQGQRAMAEKFMRGHFGTCPLHSCSNQRVLPIGVSDIVGS
jgi:casein kinase II subunit beta